MWFFGEVLGSKDLMNVTEKFNGNGLTFITLFFSATTVFAIDMIVRR